MGHTLFLLSDGVKTTLSAENSVEIFQLPELDEEKVEAEYKDEEELTFHEKIVRLFNPKCVIQIGTYDVSGMIVMNYDEFETDKYPEGSTITVLALWDHRDHRFEGVCGLYYSPQIRRNSDLYKRWEKTFRAVHEEPDIVALDFLMIRVERDRYGHDSISGGPGYSLQKQIVEKINWDRIRSVNITYLPMSFRANSDFFTEIFEDIKKRWEASATDGS